jgi:WD40 repeat protein
LDRDRHLGDIEVEPQSMRIKGDGYEMRVDSAAFSSDGTTLVTSDRYYSSGGRDGDVSLKFWTLRADGSPPALNTRVDGAHKNSITAAVFHPKEPLMVTVSLDRKFKVWTRQPAKGGESPEEKLMLPWQCRSVGFYRKLAANCAAFSPDGSLLAIGYGPYATLWEPQSSTLREVLPPTTRGVSPIKGLAFIASSPFLVGYTADQLIVWNLLSCIVVWSYSVQTKHLAADATSNRFVIASTLGAGSEAHDFLLVFSAATAKPSFVYICPRSVAIQAVTFAPPARSSGSSSGSNVARIVFLDGNQELVSLEENVPSRRIINSSGTELPVPASSGPAVYEKVFGIAAPALPYSVLSPFSAHTSGSAKADTSALASLASVPSTLRPEDLAKILHGASHALPPIGRLLEPLFARLILPATSNAAASTPGPQQNAVPSAASPSAPAAGPIANGISPVELSAESFSLKLPADAFTEALRSLATVPSADSAQLKRPASLRRAAKRAAPEVAVPAAPAPETPARTPRKKSNNKQ